MIRKSDLLTPRDWQCEALVRAAALTGTLEGSIALVEAKRYGALADEIQRLNSMVEAGTPSQSMVNRIATQQGWRPPHPIDWGEVDGELLSILGTGLITADGSARDQAIVNELRTLLRKVSGQ